MILINLHYWTKDFDIAFESTKERVKISELNEYLKSDKHEGYNRVDDVIFSNVATIYDCEGYTLDILKCFIQNDTLDRTLIFHLYKLGFLKLAAELEKIDSAKEFYYYEVQLANGYLTNETINNYLKQLYKKETLEIIQSHYTKQKLSNDYVDTSKFVVTNPYTKGIILLINAEQETDSDLKVTLFKQALLELYHIKFFYLEALLKYSTFLKEKGSEEYLERLKEGLDLAKEHKFKYLEFLYSKEFGGEAAEYDEELNYANLNLSKPEIDKLVREYKKTISK